eukprot:10457011-Lingulodinium_polyedra.AAC.1
MPVAIATILDTIEAHGLKPNLKEGKTEAMLHLVGPKAEDCKREVAYNGGIPFISAYRGGQVLLTTKKYKHMGAIAQVTGQFLPEVKNRATQTKAVLRQLAHVFKHEDLEKAFRFQLAETLLDPRLFYGAATWPALRAPEALVV